MIKDIRYGIPLELKRACVEAHRNGMTSTEIYRTIFQPLHDNMSEATFRTKLQVWQRGAMADQRTEEAGTYPGMIAHAATVQVDGAGNITQAWIKQHSGINTEDILEAIRENVQPVQLPKCDTPGDTMLEIPIFDAHFGVATLDDYTTQLAEILDILKTKHWAEVHCIIGQDCLHTNDLRGHTAKGTDIGRIPFTQAWRDAWAFWCTILETATEVTPKLYAHYSKGNHDEATAWCFFKALEARFSGTLFFADDSLAPRKCFTWQGCFVGYGHCEYVKHLDKIFRDFVMDFPDAFSSCSCREIHTGHLHSESYDDGIVVRRLASAVPPDEWSKDNGYVGVHKRFQLFEYSPGRLRSIYYV